MSTETNNPTTEEKKTNVMEMSNILRNLFDQANVRPDMGRRVRIEERKDSSDSEEQDDDHDDHDDRGGEEEEEWESLGNLLDSHQRLCQAFLLLLKERHE
jgi:hypothetical protein